MGFARLGLKTKHIRFGVLGLKIIGCRFGWFGPQNGGVDWQTRGGISELASRRSKAKKAPGPSDH